MVLFYLFRVTIKDQSYIVLFHYGTIFLGSINDTSGVGGGGE
jgi:hypothetical protein